MFPKIHLLSRVSASYSDFSVFDTFPQAFHVSPTLLLSWWWEQESNLTIGLCLLNCFCGWIEKQQTNPNKIILFSFKLRCSCQCSSPSCGLCRESCGWHHPWAWQCGHNCEWVFSFGSTFCCLPYKILFMVICILIAIKGVVNMVC